MRLGDGDRENCKEGELLDRRVLHLLGPRMADWEARRDRLSIAQLGQQQKREMDRLWTLWSRLAEEVLIALDEGAEELPTGLVKGLAARKRGRGTRKMIQTTDLVLQRRHQEGRPHTVTL